MVVCKYFLQGTCKFGTYCHYDHQAPSNYTSFSDNHSSSILRQANFGAQNTKPAVATPANVDVNTLVKSVVNDMTLAEKGGQWLLSSYAPFKEKPAFPGFEDQSFEEIRLGFYEAQKSGTMNQYKQQLQVMLQNTMIKIKALENPSQEIVTVLQNIYNTPASSSSGTFGQTTMTVSNSVLNQQNMFSNQKSSPFGQANDNIFKTNNTLPNTGHNLFGGGSTGIFGSTQPQNNIFGNSPQSQNLFGVSSTQGQNNIFANKPGPASNIFGNSDQTQANSSILSPQPSTASIFGNQQSPNIFGSQPQSIQNNQTITQPVGQPGNMFAGTIRANSPPAYGQQQQQQQLIFSQSQPQNLTQQNVLPTQNQPQSIFGANLNVSTGFSNVQNQPSIPQSNNTPQNYSSSIFGGPQTSAPTMAFASPAQQMIDESIYSKLEELSNQDKIWFETRKSELDLMNIPDNPPTYEMCQLK